MKLDIGCGDKKNENSIGIDVERTPNTDVLASADSFMPFKDDTFDEIFCYHILEHSKDLLFTMNEIWRISKDNSRIHIRVPYFESIYAFSDPTHKNFFTEKTIEFFCVNDRFFSYKRKGQKFILVRQSFFSPNPILRFFVGNRILRRLYFGRFVSEMRIEIQPVKQ